MTKPMPCHRSLLFVLVLLAFMSFGAAGTRRPSDAAPAACPVTISRKSSTLPKDIFGSGPAYWNDSLIVGGLWPNGTIVFRPGGPGIVLPDGSLSMKFGWYRGDGLWGKLTITGKRLDAPAPPLRADIPDGYGDTGFQATALIFPTEGCWQVTGKVGRTSLTFVTRVVRVWKAHTKRIKS